MNDNLKATLVEEGGKIASDVIRLLFTPTKPKPKEPTSSPVTHTLPAPVAFTPEGAQEELSYRHECVAKHLGGASVLLREAYERANDEGMGEGTAEKVMEALNEHSGAEVDIEKMLAIPEARAMAEKLLSGVRQFRKAAWEANLPRGGGTKDDLQDARMWNTMMFKEAMDAATKNPSDECVREM